MYQLFNNYDIRIPFDINDPIGYKVRMQQYEIWMNRPEVRTALGIDFDTKDWTIFNDKAGNRLHDRFYYDRTDKYFKLLLDAPFRQRVNVLLYTGTSDFVCNHIGLSEITHGLQWSGRINFNSEAQFRDSVYGSLKSFRNLFLLKFENAGHLVPTD